MTTAMLSFRADVEDAKEIRRWSERLGIGRSELMRDALHTYLARLASERETELYEAVPVTDAEMSLAAAADWGPAEDWSDWSDAAR